MHIFICTNINAYLYIYNEKLLKDLFCLQFRNTYLFFLTQKLYFRIFPHVKIRCHYLRLFSLRYRKRDLGFTANTARFAYRSFSTETLLGSRACEPLENQSSTELS